MSRQTTAVIVVGPQSTGPWGDQQTVPTHVIRFTENSVPGWQVHSLIGSHSNDDDSTGSGTHASLDGAHWLAHELAVLLAVEVLRDSVCVKAAADAGVLKLNGRTVAFAEHRPTLALVEECVTALAGKVRLWVAILAPRSLVASDDIVGQLREWGIATEVLSAGTL